MNTTLKKFTTFLQRDWYTQINDMKTYWVNYGMILPFLYVFQNGYIQPNAVFGGNQQIGMVFLAGNLILAMLVISYKLNIGLMFDFIQDRFIDYQISILSPRLVLLEKLTFNSFFTFLMMLPFFPVVIFLMRNSFDASNVSWVKLLIMLYLASLMLNAYNIFVACFLSGPHRIMRLWIRVNLPLVMIGGFLAPWHIMNACSKYIGYITLLNPFIYATEGFRTTVIGTPHFFSFYTCVMGLLVFSCLFFVLGLYYFKQRTDHI